MTVPAAPTKPRWSESPVGFYLTIAGILASLVGLVTPWLRIDSGANALISEIIEQEYGSETPIGITLDDGILAAVVLAAFVVVMVIHYRKTTGRGFAIAGIVIGAVMAVISIIDLADVADRQEEFEAFGASIDVGIGLYLSVLGGILALAGAIVATVTAKKGVPATPVYSAPPPPGGFAPAPPPSVPPPPAAPPPPPPPPG